MRGKVSHSTNGGFQIRITPAYAGKRPFPHVRDWRTQDHPRLCGEKVPAGNAYSIVRGSPPPMRGKGSVLTYSVPEYGITPAYAGKSSRSQNSRLERRDHPRLCGEKTIPLLCRRSTEGSPPPMRGKVDSMYEVGFQSRITPAYAGKSKKNVNVHGKNHGSPPPMRGKVLPPCYPPRFPRITPAYAGKRQLELVRAFLMRDHPRLCGEK